MTNLRLTVLNLAYLNRIYIHLTNVSLSKFKITPFCSSVIINLKIKYNNLTKLTRNMFKKCNILLRNVLLIHTTNSNAYTGNYVVMRELVI